MNAEIQRRIFRFGAFEADETTGELRKHGVRIRLHGQPFLHPLSAPRKAWGGGYSRDDAAKTLDCRHLRRF